MHVVSSSEYDSEDRGQSAVKHVSSAGSDSYDSEENDDSESPSSSDES